MGEMKEATGSIEGDRDRVDGYLRRQDEDTFRRLNPRHTPVL